MHGHRMKSCSCLQRDKLKLYKVCSMLQWLKEGKKLLFEAKLSAGFFSFVSAAPPKKTGPLMLLMDEPKKEALETRYMRPRLQSQTSSLKCSNGNIPHLLYHAPRPVDRHCTDLYLIALLSI